MASTPRPRRESLPHGTPISAPVSTAGGSPTRSVAPAPKAHARRRPAAKPAHIAGVTNTEVRRLQLFIRVFNHSNPTDAQRDELNQLLREYAKKPIGSAEREAGAAQGPGGGVQAGVVKPGPPKGLVPTPTPAPVADAGADRDTGRDADADAVARGRDAHSDADAGRDPD